MPRLSPTMRSGTVVRWLLAEGDELPSAGSEVAVEVKAHGLTEDWSAPPGTSSSPIMEVEIHEEGFVAKLLVREGEEVHPDEAIAVIVESEQSISAVQSAFAHQGGGNPSAPILVEPATFAWQVCHAAQRESCMHIFLVPCIAPR
jgi:pyruvate dehydrogenase E2 component (dihydrolipoamide acetyltransferase)